MVLIFIMTFGFDVEEKQNGLFILCGFLAEIANVSLVMLLAHGIFKSLLGDSLIKNKN